MRKNDFIQYVKEAQFREMFITEMGWNNYRGVAALPPITIDDVCYQFTTIAERSGFQVLQCVVEKTPTASILKRIDTQLRRSAHDYIAIFSKKGNNNTPSPVGEGRGGVAGGALWVAPVRQAEKRDLVTIEYETAEKADFLFAKIDGLTFGNSERTTIIDVKERVQGSFAVNSEKITKDFYAGFQKEHKAFAKFIIGIDDHIEDKKNRNKQWYTSVMLNRLMFCYFIQKKGFLDGDFDYLRHKLEWCQREKGEDRFFATFYKGFLLQLFQDGLNSPNHHREFEQTYGRIPYLNGGLFDQHQIEQDYADIDIQDEAFQNLFAFFDKWRWHLDTRISASGKDINPDVLGYIFEQYINDRAEMGAYYTKEDITEYIGRNCIVPFLLDKINHRPSAMLRESGDRYIFDAVKQGYSEDWRERIPDYIAVGLDTTQTGLLERRKRWNEKTPEPFALPTEIWRETIERLQRCEEIKSKIINGEITNVNDFITYNLDIRQYTQDLLATTDGHLLVRHFYKALQSVTILDPTCGSGAFLFAAMNILEPLYEVCIDRMMEWHRANPNLFRAELEEINGRYRSNIQYFIYKSIILRNLYGVDIMQEATEIAKLRLFLKMVAVVEVDRRAPNLGLDPLPDIDFNIRCGNTLVGYATEQEAVAGSSADLFVQVQFRDKMEMELEKVSKAFDHFRTQQLADHDDLASVKAAKTELRDRLATLTDLLDHQLFSASHYPDFTAWRTSHQPFHWIAEYYQIIHGNGGFDVIIGNPPYVEYSSGSVGYSLSHLKSGECGNLYGNCIERGLVLSNSKAQFGFIIPVAITCSKRMEKVIKLMKLQSSGIHFSNFDDRPGKLFEMIEHLRATIFILKKSTQDVKAKIYSTKYNRWYTQCRSILFNSLCYTNVTDYSPQFVIPKISYDVENLLFGKMFSQRQKVASLYANNVNNSVFYRAAGGGYFVLFKDTESETFIDGIKEKVKAEKSITFQKSCNNSAMFGALSSTLFYWYYIANTDCRNLTKTFIDEFPITLSLTNDEKLVELGKKLSSDYDSKKYRKDTFYKTTGRNVVYFEYYPKLSKPIIDEIDKVLARHYGFTEEELDFIINYDIKYRMGDALNEG